MTLSLTDLRSRLVDRLRDKVRNGEWTERGLARAAGVSQPHVHHVLKGTRALSPEQADRIAAAAKIALFDLLEPETLAAYLAHPGCADQWLDCRRFWPTSS